MPCTSEWVCSSRLCGLLAAWCASRPHGQAARPLSKSRLAPSRSQRYRGPRRRRRRPAGSLETDAGRYSTWVPSHSQCCRGPRRRWRQTAGNPRARSVLRRRGHHLHGEKRGAWRKGKGITLSGGLHGASGLKAARQQQQQRGECRQHGSSSSSSDGSGQRGWRRQQPIKTHSNRHSHGQDGAPVRLARAMASFHCVYSGLAITCSTLQVNECRGERLQVNTVSSDAEWTQGLCLQLPMRLPGTIPNLSSQGALPQLTTAPSKQHNFLAWSWRLRHMC